MTFVEKKEGGVWRTDYNHLALWLLTYYREIPL